MKEKNRGKREWIRGFNRDKRTFLTQLQGNMLNTHLHDLPNSHCPRPQDITARYIIVFNHLATHNNLHCVKEHNWLKCPTKYIIPHTVESPQQGKMRFNVPKDTTNIHPSCQRFFIFVIYQEIQRASHTPLHFTYRKPNNIIYFLVGTNPIILKDPISTLKATCRRSQNFAWDFNLSIKIL